MLYQSCRQTMRVLSHVSSLLLSVLVGSYAIVGLGLLARPQLLIGVYFAFEVPYKDPLECSFYLAIIRLSILLP